LLYVQLKKTSFQAENDESHIKIAKTPEEIKKLLSRLRVVYEKDGVISLLKRNGMS